LRDARVENPALATKRALRPLVPKSLRRLFTVSIGFQPWKSANVNRA
jgi:hypothetical protein